MIRRATSSNVGRALVAALVALLLATASAPRTTAAGAWRAALAQAGLLCAGGSSERDPHGTSQEGCALCAACAQPGAAPLAARPAPPLAAHLAEHRPAAPPQGHADASAPAPLARGPPALAPAA